MAVTTEFCNSAKTELLTGVHNFTAGSPGDSFYVALIKASESGTYNKSTTNYSDLTASPNDEATVTGGSPVSGYTAGGKLLVSTTPTLDTDTAICDFDNTPWTLSGTGATLASSGCIIYNSTASNAAVSVHAFSGTPTASGDGASFTIQWPAAAAATAIIRLA